MSRDCRTPRPRGAKQLAGATRLYGCVGPLVILACGDGEGASSPQPAPEIAQEAGSPPENAGGDAAADANSLPATSRACGQADWCADRPDIAETVGKHALLSVWGMDASNVWAVGSGGTALHFDGAAWTRVSVEIPAVAPDPDAGIAGAPSSRVVSNLAHVWGSSSAGTWFLGSAQDAYWAHATSGGFVVSPPSPVDVPTNVILTSLSGGPNAELFYAFGSSNFPMFLRDAYLFEGRYEAGRPTWRGIPTGFDYPEGPSDLCVTSDGEVWVLADDHVYKMSAGPDADGGTDAAAPSPTAFSLESRVTFRALWGASGSDMWVAGGSGNFRRFRGHGPFADVVVAPTVEIIRDLWGSSSSDVWAVGDHATILHFDGTEWSASSVALPPEVSPFPNLYGVWGDTAGNVWAVGEGIILRHGRNGAASP